MDSLHSRLTAELTRLNLLAMEPRVSRPVLTLPLPRTIVDGDIVCQKDCIGKGMFKVYKGWWRAGSSGLQIAVKVYEAPDDDEFQMEGFNLETFWGRVRKNAQRQMACVHNNVLRIFGLCRLDDSLMLVMPLIPTGSLDAILQSNVSQSGMHGIVVGAISGHDNKKRSLALADLFA
eukprot:1563187-Amphidinium_carterae.1